MSTPRTRFIDANGLELAVHDWGGDGPPVLLAHPTGFHGRIWAPIATRLVAQGRRVHSFDFRGHGDSEAPPVDAHDYSWAGFAADALAVARHLDLAGDPRLLACGHSKGGAALLLGEADAPGTYARIWAYEPIMFTGRAASVAAGSGMADAARRRRAEWPSVEVAYESYSAKPPLSVMADDARRAYVEYGLRDGGDGVFRLKCRPEVEARIYEMGVQNGLWERLGEIDAPVRIVCGETSTDISPAFGARIAHRLRHGTTETMTGAGHFGPQQDADRAVASMLQFSPALRGGE